MFTTLKLNFSYRNITVFLILSLLLSCSKGEDSGEGIKQNPDENSPETNLTPCEGNLNVNIDEVGSNSATITWSTDANFTIYELEYGLKDFTLGQGSTFQVYETSAIINNLDINTNYDFYIRGLCTDGTGNWTSPFSITTICNEGFFEGSVRLETQSEVNAFGEMCYSGINGNLNINGFFGNDPITSLEALSGLTEVTGGLFIEYNDSLLQLNGLEGLKSVNHLHLYLNRNLVSIESLSGLTEITSIGNPQGLEDVAGISIADCYALTSLEGLQNINEVGRLSIKKNFNLEDLQGLRGVKQVTDRLILYQNSKIVSMEGLNLLEYVGERLQIDNLNSLTSLNGLESLRTVGTELRLYYNDSLVSLEALSNLQSVDELIIRSNEMLNSLSGINLDVIENTFWLESRSLVNFSGITATATSALLNIGYCDQLTSFSGLETLVEAGPIYINQNKSLVNLEGLDGLRSVNNFIQITDNTILSDFCNLSDLVNIGGFSGDWNVSSNLLNPSLLEMQNGNCN